MKREYTNGWAIVTLVLMVVLVVLFATGASTATLLLLVGLIAGAGALGVCHGLAVQTTVLHKTLNRKVGY